MKTNDFKAKDPVKRRSKSIKNGNLSLYLDIYFKGRRKSEFLRLHLIQPPRDHFQNRRTLELDIPFVYK